jgi:hypothetical protein
VQTSQGEVAGRLAGWLLLALLKRKSNVLSGVVDWAVMQ